MGVYVMRNEEHMVKGVLMTDTKKKKETTTKDQMERRV